MSSPRSRGESPEAGAVAIFSEALDSDLTVDQFAAMGYRLVIFPVMLQCCAMTAMETSLRTLCRDGTQERLIDQMQTREDLYTLLEHDMTTPAVLSATPHFHERRRRGTSNGER